MKKKKRTCLVLLLISLIVVLILIEVMWGIKERDEQALVKERLCKKNNFTWEYRDDYSKMIISRCYNINNDIIVFYNLYNLNGTNYLSMGN